MSLETAPVFGRTDRFGQQCGHRCEVMRAAGLLFDPTLDESTTFWITENLLDPCRPLPTTSRIGARLERAAELARLEATMDSYSGSEPGTAGHRAWLKARKAVYRLTAS